jgi:hypothetical protein
VIESAFKTLSIFVGYTERDRAFIPHVPHEGDRVFWINRIIPMDDVDLFQELKMESPASVDYHRLQPHVTGMLAKRASARHLICRDPGEPNAFFSGLEDRVARHRRSTERQKKSGPTLSVLSGGPFRFLDHYRVEDAELFFGREQETEDVVEMIRKHQLSVLFGALGRGKTSLLSAGVMAWMLSEAEESDEDHGTPWLPVYVRCGDDPIEATREAISDTLVEHDIARIEDDSPLPDLLAEAVRLAGRPIVLLIDSSRSTSSRPETGFSRSSPRNWPRRWRSSAKTFACSCQSVRTTSVASTTFSDHFPEILHNLYGCAR